jgi:hypothetical protein
VGAFLFSRFEECMGRESEWSRSDEKCLGWHFENEESRATAESRESHCSLQKIQKTPMKMGVFDFSECFGTRIERKKCQLNLAFFAREPGDGGESRVPLLASENFENLFFQ